jgi:hypothetical protein
MVTTVPQCGLQMLHTTPDSHINLTEDALTTGSLEPRVHPYVHVTSNGAVQKMACSVVCWLKNTNTHATNAAHSCDNKQSNHAAVTRGCTCCSAAGSARHLCCAMSVRQTASFYKFTTRIMPQCRSSCGCWHGCAGEEKPRQCP